MSIASWRPVGMAMAAAVLGASMAACGHSVAPGAGGTLGPSATATPAPTHSAAPAPTHSVAPSPARSVPPRPSAADQLTGFFAAAATADGQLKQAAAGVNEGVGKKNLNFSPAALAAVKALDTSPAARAIPAGLPPELLRRVLVVYSDLVSRHLALARIWDMHTEYPVPVSTFDGKYLYRCLGNGAPAAANFGSDLASARALAVDTPPVTPPAPDSRQAAELALRIYDINLRNSGCMSCGGYVASALNQIVWQPENESGVGPSDGYISGIRFRATYHAGSGWDVLIWAC
jgi:hypothetical protein